MFKVLDVLTYRLTTKVSELQRRISKFALPVSKGVYVTAIMTGGFLSAFLVCEALRRERLSAYLSVQI